MIEKRNETGLDRRFILRFCGDGDGCSPRFPSAILHGEAGSANYGTDGSPNRLRLLDTQIEVLLVAVFRLIGLA
jgi:hypothetical protein